MKKILLFIGFVLSFSAAFSQTGNDTTKYTWYKYLYGERLARGRFDSVLMHPNDTTYSKYGTAIKNGTLYVGNGIKWSLVTGGGGGNTIYTADDTLQSDRSVYFRDQILTFTNNPTLGNSSQFVVNLNSTFFNAGTFWDQSATGTISGYSTNPTNINGLLFNTTYAEIYGSRSSGGGHSSRVRGYSDSLVLNSTDGFYRFRNPITSTDTTTYKPAALDATGKLIRLDRWPGSGAGGGTIQNIYPINLLTVIDDSTFENGGIALHHTHYDGSSNYDIFFDSTNLYYTGPFATLSGDTANYKLLVRNASTGKLVPMNWNTTGAGGGALTNVGSGYRWAVPGTSNVKTYFANAPLVLDSATSNSLRITADTSTALTGLATKAYIGNTLLNSTQGVYNVLDYGAKHDGVDILGGISNGSNVYTATAPTFTSADVGKVIEIFGAGASWGSGSKRLVATITGFTNSTVVTLSKNASTTVSGARTAYGTDNTVAFQAAIDAAFTGGKGGKVFIPNGYYIIAGALNQSYYGENPNAQIAIPVVGTDATTFATRTNILIEGQSIPEWLPASIGADFGPPRTGVLLKSIIDGTGQMPAVFGSKGFHGELDSINYNFLTMRNLTIVVPPDSAGLGPTMTAINGYFMGSLMCENVLVSIDNSINTSKQPQNETAGIITSKKNSEIMSYLTNALACGFKYNIIASEHCQMNQVVAEGGHAGFVFPENFYTSYGVRLGAYWNMYSVYVPNVKIMGRIPASSAFFNIASLNTEIFLSAYTPSVWYNNLATVYDPANAGHGTINAIIVARAQFGTMQQAFVKNGGDSIICTMIGNQYNSVDTVTGKIQIGNKYSNTSLLRMDFSNLSNSGAAIEPWNNGTRLYSFSASEGATFQGSANATSGAQWAWFDRVNNNYAGGWANSDWWIGQSNSRYNMHVKPPNASVVGLNIFADGQGSFNQGTETTSALFELNSTTKGFLTTRMNTTQQNAISSPVNGLIIYNTDSALFRYYNGSAWLSISAGSGAGAATPTWAQVLTAGNLSNSQQQARMLDYLQTNWQFKVGNGNLQAYAFDNFFFQSNAHFNGTNYVRDTTGTAQQLQFVTGDLYIKTAASGSTGSTITWNVPQRIFANSNTMFHQGTGLADQGTGLVQVVSSTQAQLALHYDASNKIKFAVQSNGDTRLNTNANTTQMSLWNSGGRVGVGTNTDNNLALFSSTATSGYQLAAVYDATHYFGIGANSSGDAVLFSSSNKANMPYLVQSLGHIESGVGGGAAPTTGTLGTNVTSATVDANGTDLDFQVTLVTSGAASGTLFKVTFSNNGGSPAWRAAPIVTMTFHDATTAGAITAPFAGATSTTNIDVGGTVSGAGTYKLNFHALR